MLSSGRIMIGRSPRWQYASSGARVGTPSGNCRPRRLEPLFRILNGVPGAMNEFEVYKILSMNKNVDALGS